MLEKIKRKFIHPFLWFIAFYFTNRKAQKFASTYRYTICITTFLLRYEAYFKPLIKKIAYLFGDQEIIVLVNGHYDEAEQKQYLRNIEKYLRSFSNVKLITYLEPRGLSHLWNTGIQQSNNDGVFILNDDIDISLYFRQEIEKSGILESQLATNGGSWSQFYISKHLYERVGPFDEGLKEIGGEDDDYLVRMKILGLEDNQIHLRSVWSIRKKKIVVNSYGKVMAEQKGGYSTYNTNYLESKWSISKQPIDGGVWVRGYYWKLKTPVISEANG